MEPASAEVAAPIRILLVDDHRCMLWGLDRLIASEHPQMTIAGKASTRDEIFAALQAGGVDLILLDLDLNGDNSLDFIDRIQAASPARILVLTGLRDPAVHERAMLAGARGVVLKDVPADVILRAIRRVHAGEVWIDRGTVTRLIDRAAGRADAAPADPAAARIATLTLKEREIVVAMAAQPGSPNKRLADRLCISEHTLRNHLTTIFDKLAVRNRFELTMFALDHRITSPRDG